MKIAAYRQFNDRIPETARCCKTGRLKGDYGVESMPALLLSIFLPNHFSKDVETIVFVDRDRFIAGIKRY